MNTNKSSQERLQQITTLGLTIAVIVLLTLFCKAMNYPLILPLLLSFFGIHLYFTGKANLKLFVHLGFLLTIITFISAFTLQYTDFSVYYIPVACIATLAMLLFADLHLAFLMAFICSIWVSLILGGGFELMLIFFFGGVAGAYSVKDARTRGQLITAGLIISGVQIIAFILFNFQTVSIFSKSITMTALYPLMANGLICAFVVLASLKGFEDLFGVVTNYRLLELSDFNQPLLKRMILEAPGTYHHSLVVSNLSEAAADAIGANALLTRVGAYYHDIGKMVKPEYFTENQLMGGNKHDYIEPSMSRLVILNHVKEGIELAKKNKLNPSIIDFIPQHHGTSLVYYFYQKALEEAADGETVDESEFRYPGPKPQTRETAITLLADSVEGATRALDDPSPSKIEETVKKVINNKFIDGQLDECNLTLKEIEKISSTFIRMLSAMYHGRIKYPEKKSSTTKAARNSNQTSNQQQPKNPPETNEK